MIQVRNLTKVYPDGTKALDDVSVDIQDGEFVSIIGLSGAGKSTFLRCLNGLVKPSQGSVQIDGQEVASAPESTLRSVRKKIGFIFQQFNLVTRLSVLHNVLTGRLGYRSTLDGLLGLFSPGDRQIALDYIRRVGLGEKVFTRASNLSGGQQQRVAIARAMAQEPRYILADEPMASLDPKLSGVILGLLKMFNTENGITVLVNLHVLELAKEYAQRILGFQKGRLVFDGPPQALTPETVEMIYSGTSVEEL